MRTSRCWDAGVVALGLAVAAGALATWWQQGADPVLGAIVLLCLPLGVLLSRLPLNVGSGVDGLVVPLEPALLVGLLCLQTPATALTAWCAVAAVAYLVEPRALSTRLVNTGSAALSGLAAALVVSHLAPSDLVTPAHLLAAGLAAAAYFATDLLLSVVVVHLRTGHPVALLLREAGAVRGLAVFESTAVLAYLAAVVSIRLPVWVAVLLVVPLLAVVVAARSSREASNRRRQQRALFEASLAVHATTTREGLCAALTDHAREVVSAGRLHVVTDPAAAREPHTLAVPVPPVPGEPERWLSTPRARDSARVRDDEAALTALAGLLAASLSRVRLVEETAHHALTDDLTGLANRRRVTRDLEEAVTAQAAVGVLFVDLDGFKAVNDGLGHAAGDELLVDVADRLRSAVAGRCPDGHVTVARLGGDEFAVLVPDDAPGLVEDLALDVVAVLGAPFLLAAGPAVIGASVGVAVSDPDDDVDALLSRADAAMYRAKRAGGGRTRSAVDGADPTDQGVTGR